MATAAGGRTRTRFHVLVAVAGIILQMIRAISAGFPEQDPQAAVLIKFRYSLENPTELKSWDSSVKKVCNGSSSSWKGVRCLDNRVRVLQLEGMGLGCSLDVDALSNLTSLWALSVMNNSFTGAVPEVKKLRGLRALYLSFNLFSGEISGDAFVGLNAMRRIVMNNNELKGRIPASLTKLPRLVDLQLQNNEFEGEIPDFPQEHLVVNLANNKLQGNNLRGTPMDPCPKKNALSKLVIILIAAAGAAVALLAILVAFLCCRSRRLAETTGNNKLTTEFHDREPSRKAPVNKVVDHRHSVERASMENDDEHLHFVNNGRQKFELESMLLASAQVLGSGNLGSSYKADLVDGPSLVVKRFKQMSNVGKERFFEHMRRIGSLSHPNVLPVVAFYYRKEEKLLITDFAELGSLAGHLHEQVPTNLVFDWPTRLNIIKGVAKGLAYLHQELPALNLPHGHLKSSNVLLDKNFEPLLADYALSLVINREQAPQFMVAYKSPEFMHHIQVSRKTDVWSLGILILELLTGRFPANYLRQGMVANADLVSWVNSVVREEWTGEVFDKDMSSTRNGEGQMLKLLNIGMCCSEKNVEKRWDLREAVERIEELKNRDADDTDYSSYASTDDMNSSYSSKGMADAELSSLSVAGKAQ